jgi:catechol 2,3-dioxygenase-like lactoylglutathione lyase family enzyme
MIMTKPIFRIFDYQKAKEFYIDWLGFKISGEFKFDNNSPLYLIITLDEIEIHLSEHHGDCSPGAKIMIENFIGLTHFHENLLKKEYKYNKPSIERAFWNTDISCMEVVDPFGNKILFTGN